MSQSTVQELAALISERMAFYHVPGAAVGIWHAGQVYTAGFGVTSLENPLPVTDETLFQVGSITKTMTGTLVMRLVEQGRLDLDVPLRTYLPDLRLADEETARRVTMRHLLTHVGGWIGDYFEDLSRGDDALARMADKLAEMSQVTPLGETYAYNNLGFCLAGRVIEVITGQPFEIAVQENLFAPLGMSHSFFLPGDVITHRFSVGHAIDDDGQAVVVRPWAVPRSTSPAGGAVTTVKDLLTYARCHLGEGPRLLSPETLALMQTPQVQIKGDKETVGLAWHLNRVGEYLLVEHDGGTEGQSSQLTLVPQCQFALALVTNADRGDGLIHDVTQWVWPHLLGFENPDPLAYPLPDDQLALYAGRYVNARQDLEFTLHEGGLMGHLTVIGEDDPPLCAPFRFYDTDCITIVDGPFKGIQAEFLRSREGDLIRLRLGGRILSREKK